MYFLFLPLFFTVTLHLHHGRWWPIVYLLWEFCLLSLSFFKYLSRHDSNDECIILAKMQHLNPHMIFKRADICFNWGGNSERKLESLIIILPSSSLASLRPLSFGSLTRLLFCWKLSGWVRKRPSAPSVLTHHITCCRRSISLPAYDL